MSTQRPLADSQKQTLDAVIGEQEQSQGTQKSNFDEILRTISAGTPDDVYGIVKSADVLNLLGSPDFNKVRDAATQRLRELEVTEDVIEILQECLTDALSFESVRNVKSDRVLDYGVVPRTEDGMSETRPDRVVPSRRMSLRRHLSGLLSGMGSTLNIMPAPSSIEIDSHTSSFEELMQNALHNVVTSMERAMTTMEKEKLEKGSVDVR